MNAQSLLKQIHHETLRAINNDNQTVPVKELPKPLQAKVAEFRRLSAAKARLRASLSKAGYDTYQLTDSEIRRTHRNNIVEKKRQKLALSHRAATIALMKASTPKDRGVVIERFIAETKHLGA